jgi:hypothetical protein
LTEVLLAPIQLISLTKPEVLMRRLVVLLMTIVSFQTAHALAPYWVSTEDDQFLNDREGLPAFTLSYYSIEIRFQQEEQRIVARKHFTIDDRGNIAEETAIDFSEDSPIVTQYIYDDSNRLVEERMPIKEDLAFTLRRYSYEGNTQIERSYSLSGLDSLSKHVYDEQGRVIEHTEFDSAGKVIYSFIYAYQNGRTVTDGYDATGMLTSRTVSYFSSGRQVKREDYYGGKLTKTIMSEYTDAGQLLREVGFGPAGTQQFSLSYGHDNGRVSSKKLANADGSEYLTEYEYDADSRLSKVTFSNRVSKFGKEYYETEYIIERTRVK